MRIAAATGLIVIVLGAALASWIAPNPPHEQFRQFLYAPPMRPHVIDDEGRWHRPFVYQLRVANRLQRQYDEDRSRRIPLVWFSEGRLIALADSTSGPLLLLGGDSLGRDIFSRLVYGARTSLGIALTAVGGALLLGALIGAVAGYVGGWVDELLTRASEFVIVLPAIYVILALRAAMPLVLSARTIFLLISGILAVVGWPYVARGVRSIVAVQNRSEYAEAARAAGAGHRRILFRHLMPAARGFVEAQAGLLIPAFILAEATLSYVGLGFPEPTPSWGSMLREAAQARAMVDFPWTLAPALAIFVVVFAVNVLVQSPRPSQLR